MGLGAQSGETGPTRGAGSTMKITDAKCAVIGDNPVVRIVTDAGSFGIGEGEYFKPYLKPFVMPFRDAVIGEDPTDVERVMMRIRRRGAFKPWGAAISMIEHALWDIAGKAAGVPVYKLLGGKVRDEVRVYNGAIRREMSGSFAACSTFSAISLAGTFLILSGKARFLRTVLFG
jgi:L-alanine-DL-glutamate epimerase-like enolase superfamily enzyme